MVVLSLCCGCSLPAAVFDCLWSFCCRFMVVGNRAGLFVLVCDCFVVVLRMPQPSSIVFACLLLFGDWVVV